MAFLVLFSTMSFSIGEHYCGDTLVDSNLFSKAESCGMEMEKPLSIEGCSIQKNNCCKDVLKLVQGKDELNSSISKIDFQQQLIITSFYVSYINLFEGVKENVTLYEDYAHPLVIRQIYKLDETYLI